MSQTEGVNHHTTKIVGEYRSLRKKAAQYRSTIALDERRESVLLCIRPRACALSINGMRYHCGAR